MSCPHPFPGWPIPPAVGGEAAIDREAWKEAIEAYSQAIRLKPKDGLSYFFRGWAYREVDQPDQAIADFTKAINHSEPVRVQAYYNRALAYQTKKKWQKAAEDLTQAIQLEPKTPAYYHTRAEAYRQMGQRDKSEADLRRSKELRDSEEQCGAPSCGHSFHRLVLAFRDKRTASPTHSVICQSAHLCT